MRPFGDTSNFLQDLADEEAKLVASQADDRDVESNFMSRLGDIAEARGSDAELREVSAVVNLMTSDVRAVTSSSSMEHSGLQYGSIDPALGSAPPAVVAGKAAAELQRSVWGLRQVQQELINKSTAQCSELEAAEREAAHWKAERSRLVDAALTSQQSLAGTTRPAQGPAITSQQSLAGPTRPAQGPEHDTSTVAASNKSSDGNLNKLLEELQRHSRDAIRRSRVPAISPASPTQEPGPQAASPSKTLLAARLAELAELRTETQAFIDRQVEARKRPTHDFSA